MVGVILTLIDDFTVLCVGQFLYGLSVGSFSVFCPLFIAEVAPIEIKGPACTLS